MRTRLLSRSGSNISYSNVGATTGVGYHDRKLLLSLPLLRRKTMAAARSRREFLADVGRGTLIASVGSALAADLGLAASSVLAADAPPTLSFGALDPLVALMQETPLDKLLPVLVGKLKSGTELRELVAAA